MLETNDRIERLEREVRRLQIGMLVLAVALAATCALGATQGTPDELKLRRLAIMDAEGKERVVASTTPDGIASIQHYDRDGKLRIGIGTAPDGEAGIMHVDTDGKKRIYASTLPDGRAFLSHFDRDEKRRISQGTRPDGQAGIGINDGKEQFVWGETSSK